MSVLVKRVHWNLYRPGHRVDLHLERRQLTLHCVGMLPHPAFLEMPGVVARMSDRTADAMGIELTDRYEDHLGVSVRVARDPLDPGDAPDVRPVEPVRPGAPV